jgi:hypothetical protein
MTLRIADCGLRIGLRIGLRAGLRAGLRIGLRTGLRIGLRCWPALASCVVRAETIERVLAVVAGS